MYNVPHWYHSLTHSHTHASSGFSLTPLRCPCSSPSARGVHRAQALRDLVHSRPRHGRSLGHGVERWFAKRKRCETREAESTKLSKLGLRQLTIYWSLTYTVLYRTSPGLRSSQEAPLTLSTLSLERRAQCIHPCGAPVPRAHSVSQTAWLQAASFLASGATLQGRCCVTGTMA